MIVFIKKGLVIVLFMLKCFIGLSNDTATIHADFVKIDFKNDSNVLLSFKKPFLKHVSKLIRTDLFDLVDTVNIYETNSDFGFDDKTQVIRRLLLNGYESNFYYIFFQQTVINRGYELVLIKKQKKNCYIIQVFYFDKSVFKNNQELNSSMLQNQVRLTNNHNYFSDSFIYRKKVISKKGNLDKLKKNNRKWCNW